MWVIENIEGWKEMALDVKAETRKLIPQTLHDHIIPLSDYEYFMIHAGSIKIIRQYNSWLNPQELIDQISLIDITFENLTYERSLLAKTSRTYERDSLFPLSHESNAIALVSLNKLLVRQSLEVYGEVMQYFEYARNSKMYQIDRFSDAIEWNGLNELSFKPVQPAIALYLRLADIKVTGGRKKFNSIAKSYGHKTGREVENYYQEFSDLDNGVRSPSDSTIGYRTVMKWINQAIIILRNENKSTEKANELLVIASKRI